MKVTGIIVPSQEIITAGGIINTALGMLGMVREVSVYYIERDEMLVHYDIHHPKGSWCVHTRMTAYEWSKGDYERVRAPALAVLNDLMEREGWRANELIRPELPLDCDHACYV